MSESKGFLSRFKPMSPKVTRKFTPSRPNTTDDVVTDNQKSTTNIKHDNTIVTQNEVEEKLKAMRQKRLSRLNIFVADQVKLSESRSHDNDIEEAIVSIKKAEQDSTKVSIKSIPENNNDNDSYKKTSSAKKFINKLSCVNHSLTTSVDDLTVVESTKVSRHSLPNSSDDRKEMTQKQRDEEVRSNSYKMYQPITNVHIRSEKDEVIPQLPPRNLKHRVFGKVELPLKHAGLHTKATDERIFTDNTFGKANSEYEFNPKTSHKMNQSYQETEQISPKLNTTIDNTDIRSIDHDKSILDVRSSRSNDQSYGKTGIQTQTGNIQIQSREDESPSRSFTHRTFGKMESKSPDDTPPRPSKICTYEMFGKLNSEFEIKTFKNNPNKDQTENKSSVLGKFNISKDVVKNSYENVVISDSKTGTKIVTPGIDTSVENVIRDQEVSEKNSAKVYENIDIASDQSVVVDKNPPREILRSDTPRSPLPSPRKTTQDEKILKKFLANYLILCEILQNDSRVDYDELEDLKIALDDTAKMLDDYRLKLNQLEAKPMLSDKLEVIRKKTEDIKSSLTTFKGLKRDVSYLEISNRLSSYFFEIKNDSGKGTRVDEQKKVLLSEIDQCIRDLETRVELNEKMLRQVLEEQVMLIVTNRLIPTIV